jgi:hypothetical protein
MAVRGIVIGVAGLAYRGLGIGPWNQHGALLEGAATPPQGRSGQPP